MKSYLFKSKFVILAYIVLAIIAFTIFFMIGNNSFSLFVNSYHHLFFDYFFKYATHLGEFYLAVPACLLALVLNRKLGIVMSLISIVSSLITQFNKHFVFEDSMRPSVILKDYPLHFVDGVEMATHFSFPSGHTTFAFAFFGFLALNSTKTIFKLLYLFLAVLVAFSRIYLLQHFLIDTIVGSMIGFLCALIGHFAYEKINSKNTAS